MNIKAKIKDLIPYKIIRHLESKKRIRECERVLSKVDVIVNKDRNQTINILFAGLIKSTMSGGPLSILYFINFLYNIGLNVRIIFYRCVVSEQAIRENISKIDNRFLDLSRHVEIDYSIIRNSIRINPVYISQSDMTVVTLWDGAFFAQQIQAKCLNRKFIYFIQEDERIFYKHGTEHVLVEQSYNLDYYSMFSTEILRNYFYNENIGNFKEKYETSISQQSPSYFSLPSKEVFIQRGKKKKFVFYLQNDRNCSEYVLYLIKEAIRREILTNDWEIFGLAAMKNEIIEVTPDIKIQMKTSIPLKLYTESLHTYDVGLILMEAPHVCMLPIDLSLSGCVVVTNTYKNKTVEELKKISENIYGSSIDVESMMSTLKLAIMASNDIETRYKNATESCFPIIDDIFNEKHKKWVDSILEELK